MNYFVNKEHISYFLLVIIVFLSLISFEKTIYSNIYSLILICILSVALVLLVTHFVMERERFEQLLFQVINHNNVVILLIYFLFFSSFLSSLSNGLISLGGLLRLFSTSLSLVVFFLIIPKLTHTVIGKVDRFIIYLISLFSIVGIMTKVNGSFFIYDTYYGRVNSIYFDPNYFGAIAGVAVILSAMKKGFLFKVLCVLNFTALFLSNSRTAFLALCLTMLLTFFYRRRVKIGTIVFTVFFIMILGISVYFLNEADFFRIEQGLNSRGDLWEIAISLIKKQPLWGYGQESIPYLLAEYGVENSSTHNAYFDYMLSYGIPCMVLYIFIMFIAFYRGIKNKVNRSMIQVPFFLLICSGAINISIGGLGATSLLFTLYLGMCNGMPIQDKGSKG
ncbi:hypothetical protein AMS59_08020 [Lysinibacillus sp. FJAT-14745]|uniref:O-antigen ligase family protein n=1 Tax=Lysinibacillus sp. FJAT-14745 TaxID=1704289 RepID=UPI0006AB79C1|nr:O-antigen ligase family protein [Lysinibacillus sp. FJAT-14745]KOP78978.1 hypothetical protein AMS59_08020 [Lysinibacillus sp. FJAT-14745]